MGYTTPLLRERGAAAPDLSDLVPPALTRAEAILKQCTVDLAALLIDDWDDTIRYALDGVQEHLDGMRQAIEDAPGAILDERAGDYPEDDR